MHRADSLSFNCPKLLYITKRLPVVEENVMYGICVFKLLTKTAVHVMVKIDLTVQQYYMHDALKRDTRLLLIYILN
jgi:hypothetical protein